MTFWGLDFKPNNIISHQFDINNEHLPKLFFKIIQKLL